MIVTRSSGPTSLRMNAAAPALIASNSASSSSSDARTMIPVDGQLALDPLRRLDAARGRQREVHQDDVGRRSRGRVDRERPSSASPTISKSGSRSEDVRDADPEEGVVVDDEDPGPLVGAAPVRAAPPAVRPGIASCTALLSRSDGIVSRDDGAAAGRDRTSNAPPISSARSRMNCRPKLRRPRAATAPMSKPRPSSRTSRTQRSPSRRVASRTWRAPACLRTFCSASWSDPQDDRLLGVAEVVGRRAEVDLDRGPGQRRGAWRPRRGSRRRGRARRGSAAGAG